MGRTQEDIYHLESIQLLLYLLRKHRCQSITRSNLAPSVVFNGRPSLVELNSRAETNVASRDSCNTFGGPWHAR